MRLAARDAARLEPDRDDLVTRYGVTVTLHEFDALDLEGHEAFVKGLPELPDIAVCAVGAMGTQEENAASPTIGASVMRANFEGPAAIFAHLANAMEARGSGTLVGISSVAGRTGPRVELRLRRGKGGLHGVPVGPAQPAGKEGRACGHRACRASWRRP